MNMKYLTILVSACLGIGAFSGCVVVDGTSAADNSGGSGNTGGTPTTGGEGGIPGVGGSGGSGGATGGSATGGTGGGACADEFQPINGTCYTCGEFVTYEMTCEGVDLCEGGSTDLYDALVACTCTGACMDLCGDNICAGVMSTDECLACIADTAAGCGAEFNECSNDI
jgi:hypothetical protein